MRVIAVCCIAVLVVSFEHTDDVYSFKLRLLLNDLTSFRILRSALF